MNKVARFTLRPNDDKADLILGVMFSSPDAQKHLKAEKIYEIVEIMGELMIREVGPAALKLKDSMLDVSWYTDINYILDAAKGTFILTEKEIDE